MCKASGCAILFLVIGAASLMAAPADDWRRFPVLSVPTLQSAPTVDGKVETREWMAASSVDDTLDSETGMTAPCATKVRLACTATHLFVAFQTARPVTNAAPTTDDTLELELDVDNSCKAVWAFVVNRDKVVWMGTRTEKEETPKNVAVQYKARVLDTGWECEMAIPFDALGGAPAAGKVWGANWSRNDQTPFIQTSRWSYRGRFAPGFDKAGRLVFSGKPVAFQIQSGWLESTGKTGALVSVVNLGTQPVELTGTVRLARAPVLPPTPFFPTVDDALTDDLGRPRGDVAQELDKASAHYAEVKKREDRLTVPANSMRAMEVMEPETPGDYVSSAVLLQDGKAVAGVLTPFRVPDQLGVTVRAFLLTQAIEYGVDLRRLKDKLTPQSTLRVVLKDAKGAELAREAAIVIGKRTEVPGVFRVPLTAGTGYTVEVALIDGPLTVASRSASASTVRQSDVPDWWTMPKEGLTPLVPPPWTPLKADAGKVEVLGRTYEFSSRLPVPSRIVNWGREILAGPIELRAKQPWQVRSFSLASQSDDAAVYKGEMAAGNLVMKSVTRVEFDGFILIDLELSGADTVDQLDMVVPFKKQYAILTQSYTMAGGPGIRIGKHAGAPHGLITPEGFSMVPQITTWIGDDHGGLEFSCESTRGWAMADPAAAVTVKPEGDRVLFTSRIISKPVTLSADKPRMIRFAFTATPTKTIMPYLQKTREYQTLLHNFYPHDWSGPPLHWHPPVKNPEAITYKVKGVGEVKAIAKNDATHAKGFKEIYHGGWAVSVEPCYDNAVKPEMFSIPVANASFGTPGYSMYSHCYRTPMGEYMANSFAYNARALHFDGILFDTVTPWYPCSSLVHGCGWYDDDGNLWSSYGIFSQREVWKRLYRSFHGGVVAEGVINTPMARGPIMAVASFTDWHQSGESWFMKSPDLKDAYPPNTVRSFMRSEPFGFRHSNSIKSEGFPLFANERIGALMASGADPRFSPSSIWRTGYEAQSMPAPDIYNAWEWIDRWNAEFLGWWENGDYLTLSPAATGPEKPLVLGSFYLQRGKRALLTVANYEKEPLGAMKVRLDLAKAGFKPPVYAEDAITAEPIPIWTDGTMQLDILGQRYRMIKISGEPPFFRDEVLGPNLLADAPQLSKDAWTDNALTKSAHFVIYAVNGRQWASAPITLVPDSVYVLRAKYRFDQSLPGNKSTGVGHAATFKFEGEGLRGTNNRARTDYDSFSPFPTVLLPYTQALWEKTPGWTNVFAVFKTEKMARTGIVSIGCTDTGALMVKDISLQKLNP